jgi:hypothetical protein
MLTERQACLAPSRGNRAAGASGDRRRIVSPLRGSRKTIEGMKWRVAYPGLTPWAKLCRPYGAGWIWDLGFGVRGAPVEETVWGLRTRAPAFAKRLRRLRRGRHALG